MTSPASAQSVAMSAVFLRNWATLTLLPWVVFSQLSSNWEGFIAKTWQP